MKNIISGRTLINATREGGLAAAQDFPKRCTGNTTGAALEVIGFCMRKHERSNGEPVCTHISDKEVASMIMPLVNQLGLVGFTLSKPCFGGMYLQYHVFEGK